MLTDADIFVVMFPANATKEDKALLFAATHLLDYSYFEKKQGGNKK